MRVITEDELVIQHHREDYVLILITDEEAELHKKRLRWNIVPHMGDIPVFIVHQDKLRERFPHLLGREYMTPSFWYMGARHTIIRRHVGWPKSKLDITRLVHGD